MQQFPKLDNMATTDFVTVLQFYVNGKKVVDEHVNPQMTLLQYLRLKLRLTGSKCGCAEGGCGACTVMVSQFCRDTEPAAIRHYTVNACLAPVCSFHGAAVTTVEGIGSISTKLHPVQERISKCHGSQCGFCTPGIVMSMYTLLRNQAVPSFADMERHFQGNLCRCTGYRPILEGFRTFTKKAQEKIKGSCGSKSCCRNSSDASVLVLDDVDMLICPSNFTPAHESQEPVFPYELQLSDELDREFLRIEGPHSVWYRPISLATLLDLKLAYPQAKIVVGNTEVGIEMKFKNEVYPVCICSNQVQELRQIEHTETGIRVGASVTLTSLEEVLKKEVASCPKYKTRVFQATLEMLGRFAGTQIRNVASVGGNVMTASPISDLNPLFLAAGCHLTLANKDGSRTVKMNAGFFTGYRQTSTQWDEVLTCLQIPYTCQEEYFYGYKQAQRRDDDISIVNAGMRVLFQRNSAIVQEISLAFGGMAATTVLANDIASKFVGRRWDRTLVEEASLSLSHELSLNPEVPGGMVAYRQALASSFFFKFFLKVHQELVLCQTISDEHLMPKTYLSATEEMSREIPSSSQVFDISSKGDWSSKPIGKPMQHESSEKHATGEAVYVDDIPPFADELYLGLVLSTKAHAKVLSIDTTHALAKEGVHSCVGRKDVPGTNSFGFNKYKDELIFSDVEVTCQGQIMLGVLAATQDIARHAARLVKIQYEELPAIITLEEAISAKAFAGPTRCLETGNVGKAMASSHVVVHGQMRVGSQEHFYMEPQATVAVPHEGGDMEIFSATQNPTKTQMLTAAALGVPANRVVCRVKRLGGAFGGKETRCLLVTLPCAIAARKCGRAVRCVLDRDEDMVITGHRHPFLGKYQAGADRAGRLKALQVELYSNMGNTMDLSVAVMERALLHIDNAYKMENLRVTGLCCRSNVASNTAFRGFGAPQAMLVCESVLSHIAKELGLPEAQVREVNLYKDGDTTHFNMRLMSCNLTRCWRECVERSQYYTRLKTVQQFNAMNRWKKRGMSIVPTKFGISFTAPFMNQAGALVMIYMDGSVLITHGGTEMGQGLHTKIIQVASQVLEIDTSHIYINETSTNTVPNTSPTAASTSSDHYGMAVLKACSVLSERLEPYKTRHGSWMDWVQAAYVDMVNLSATGFYNLTNIDYDFEKNSGNPFNYFVYGAACSEVEIDCLTGAHQVLRTDIVMDIGKSLNPAVDIGQIEGGFIQGYGMFTMEKLSHSPLGYLYSRGPGTYKIPAFSDIPTSFNVSLLQGDNDNPRAVYSSKAVGEPPLFLAASVFFAIKNAIYSAREEEGSVDPFELNSPATAESVRMACLDIFTEQAQQEIPSEKFIPWSVSI